MSTKSLKIVTKWRVNGIDFAATLHQQQDGRAMLRIKRGSGKEGKLAAVALNQAAIALVAPWMVTLTPQFQLYAALLIENQSFVKEDKLDEQDIAAQPQGVRKESAALSAAISPVTSHAYSPDTSYEPQF